MSTSDAVKQSCSNAKGSNERPSNSDDCSTSAKPPNLKPQPSQSLPSLKPQTVAKHLTTDTHSRLNRCSAEVVGFVPRSHADADESDGVSGARLSAEDLLHCLTLGE